MLRDEHTGKFLRLSDNDAWVFERLDGTHSLIELIAMCEQRYGPPGPARLPPPLVRLPPVLLEEAHQGPDEPPDMVLDRHARQLGRGR